MHMDQASQTSWPLVFLVTILKMEKLRFKEIRVTCPRLPGEQGAEQDTDSSLHTHPLLREEGKPSGMRAHGVQGSILPRSWLALLLMQL